MSAKDPYEALFYYPRWMSVPQRDRPTIPIPAPAVIRCECGGEASGCGTHSDWCPKAKLP